MIEKESETFYLKSTTTSSEGNMTKIRSGFPQTPINLTLREEQISTILYCLEGYVQGNDDEELVEEIEEIFEVLELSLIHI